MKNLTFYTLGDPFEGLATVIEYTTGKVVENNSTDIAAINESTYDKIVVLFWVGAALYLFLGIVAIIGNGLVLYTALGEFNMGPLGHLDNVIKSLAVADMLYGLIGVPCKLSADYYVCKLSVTEEYIITNCKFNNS